MGQVLMLWLGLGKLPSLPLEPKLGAKHSFPGEQVRDDSSVAAHEARNKHTLFKSALHTQAFSTSQAAW